MRNSRISKSVSKVAINEWQIKVQIAYMHKLTQNVNRTKMSQMYIFEPVMKPRNNFKNSASYQLALRADYAQ